MDSASQIVSHSFVFPRTDITVTLNPQTLIMTFFASAAVILLGFMFSRNLKTVPGRCQVLGEAIVTSFDEMIRQSLGEEGRKFLPLILTLFLFVLVSNWMTVIPFLRGPTRDLNTTLALALIVLVVAHVSAIQKKGFIKYLKAYFEPFWFMFPSNVFSEVSKTASHAFRLFGNIFAGGVVISVVPVILLQLFKWFGFALSLAAMPLLNAFFGIFIGGVQAFVFAMLALAYIAVLRE
ncbi:MAG: ATP synthase F0 subunit A [Candidatus Omnitrophica bacterium CG11_big_fil_rev_8_21_14_0_20_42_13]|uniref:ATP synthase subunit a n=1 Tax=Candidatus Ghiorseimicrobium undicola TaxID=1974746 RepID=A0A2H0LVX2_9BACT|nr:MAG: ATP synthase F0 subunit A [Candidatus Omnitrophica bacterium CG11_big_fil_rev_8_21_14_0_20_42_13]